MRGRLVRLWHRAVQRQPGHSGLASHPRRSSHDEQPGTAFCWPQQTRAAVTLSWDDARPSQLDVGMSILNESAIRATFYLNPDPVVTRAEAWRKAVLCGHEMGNHSRHHPCSGNHRFSREHALESYTLAQMDEELRSCSDEIESLTGSRPRTFAYPCGQTFVGRGEGVQSYVPLVAGRFLAGRAFESGHPNDPTFCDLAQLNARRLDGVSFASARALVDEALEDGSWLVLAGHDIGRGHGLQTTDAGELAKLCRYLTSLRSLVWVDTVEAVAGYLLRMR